MKDHGLYTELAGYVQDIESEFEDIPKERIQTLEQIGDNVIATLGDNKTARMIYICTHNSRRSQFGQLWGITAAAFYNIEGIETYSGGTESSAFNPRAVEAVRRAGFRLEERSGQKDNPRYRVSIGEDIAEFTMFSKKYDDPFNPDQGFCAIMVCSDADEACPYVAGASERISLPYDDPKTFDGTPLEALKYNERCREIARDQFYVFNYVGNKLR
jgi:hypothetical protein